MKKTYFRKRDIELARSFFNCVATKPLYFCRIVRDGKEFVFYSNSLLPSISHTDIDSFECFRLSFSQLKDKIVKYGRILHHKVDNYE